MPAVSFRSIVTMSKQLALSIAASVLAMAAYVLFGGDARTNGISAEGPRWSVTAEAGNLPSVGQLLPALQ
jgi:hypothetical protein